MGVPSGTVTFLFTDIEGSTRLWQLDEGAMREAVQRHDELLRANSLECGGVVFSTMGDGFAVAFTSAHAALRAAELAQERLRQEQWSTAEPVRVRVGLHSGEAEECDGDFFGSAVNRAARLYGRRPWRSGCVLIDHGGAGRGQCDIGRFWASIVCGIWIVRCTCSRSAWTGFRLCDR
jgi:class 3 adenylate cyclase